MARPLLGQVDLCSIQDYPGFDDQGHGADVCRAIQSMGSYGGACVDYADWMMEKLVDGSVYEMYNTDTSGVAAYDANSSSIGISTTFVNQTTSATWVEDLPLTIRHELSHIWYFTNDNPPSDPNSAELWAYSNCWGH